MFSVLVLPTGQILISLIVSAGREDRGRQRVPGAGGSHGVGQSHHPGQLQLTSSVLSFVPSCHQTGPLLSSDWSTPVIRLVHSRVRCCHASFHTERHPTPPTRGISCLSLCLYGIRIGSEGLQRERERERVADCFLSQYVSRPPQCRAA